MQYRLLSLSLCLFFLTATLSAQPVADTVQKETPTSCSVNMDEEIRVMDSMLNIWYVQSEISKKNSVLSSLKDDTTAYDNNDTMMFQRLSKIVTAVPMAFNDRVKRFIELYSVQRQRSSSVILGLAQYYYPWMREIFDKYDVPEELIYITIIESALNPTAVSRAGATGIWQFMYNTGKLYGLQVDTYVDDRRDPYKATEAAARHFRDLYNIFNDWGLAISAYNCGAGNVRKAIQRSGGKKDFWGVCPYLPKETQNYFPAFIGAYYMMTYHNLYGISPTTLSIPTDVDTVMVDKELHFDQIAAVLDINKDEIKSLNPQYKREIIPAFKKSYPLRLRSNDLIRFIDLKDSIEKYHYNEYFAPAKDLNAPVTNSNGEIVQTTPAKYHTVRKGETQSSVARKYGISVNALRSMNHLRSNYLKVGQRLMVRRAQTTVIKAPVPTTTDSTNTVVADSTLVVKDTMPVAPTDTVKPAPVKKPDIIYVVKKGDTLSSIGRKYNKTATELAKYNHITNINSVNIGQKIRIPSK